MEAAISWCWVLGLLVSCVSAQIEWSYTQEEEPRRCLTRCDNHGEQFKWCWTSWTHWAACTPGDTDIKQTLPLASDGILCVSECGNFGGYKYDWCFTAVNPKKWAYCDAGLKVTHLSLTVDGRLCRTPCNPSIANPTCYYSYRGLAPCEPGDFPMQLPLSRSGKKCHSLCGKFGYSYNWCDTMGALCVNWDFCDENSVDKLNSVLLPKKLNPINEYSDAPVADKIKSVILATDSPRRTSPLANPNEQMQRLKLMRAMVRQQAPGMRGTVSYNHSASKVLSTAVDNVDLVHYVEARIHPRHVAADRGIDEFNGNVSRSRMVELDARKSDQATPLLAFSLGGSNDLWNMVPQSKEFIESGSLSNIEAKVMEKVRTLTDPRHYVNWEMFVRYASLHKGVKRPTSYVIWFFTCDEEGKILNEQLSVAELVDY
ncbi:Hypothetical predicted protein [Cloeon dipterum]|uniref:Fibronectin type-II domain-containing protein n=1 Tax=Cloeon dipterum TaxID=197152 RepID=A0A8S1CZW7_9INSE|nr:Hypothetical predicted protein [Cloeon dipterum]